MLGAKTSHRLAPRGGDQLCQHALFVGSSRDVISGLPGAMRRGARHCATPPLGVGFNPAHLLWSHLPFVRQNIYRGKTNLTSPSPFFFYLCETYHMGENPDTIQRWLMEDRGRTRDKLAFQRQSRAVGRNGPYIPYKFLRSSKKAEESGRTFRCNNVLYGLGSILVQRSPSKSSLQSPGESARVPQSQGCHLPSFVC